MLKPSLPTRLYRYKLLAVGASLVAVGLLLNILVDWLDSVGTDHLIIALGENLADVLVVFGGFGIAVEFFTGKEKDEADAERTRTVLKELTPDFTDAVVRGFAVEPADLKRVATPELLDTLATNAMALRLGDEQFARELYAEIRDQGIRAAERWYDVEVNVRLSTAVERDTKGIPLFDVTVEWQYTTIPSHSVRRFACVSDRDEFNELVTDIPSTSTWFMRARPGMDASSRECYELLSFTVDGEARPIRRSGRKTGQTYSVTIGDEVVAAGQPVRIRHVYRTVTSQAGHWLFFEIPQPSKNLSLRFDYTDTAIASLRTLDLLPASQGSQVAHLPANVHGREVSVDVPGWLLPRAGLAFVWTLSSEEPSAAATHADAA
jgi:hypothetical protein